MLDPMGLQLLVRVRQDELLQEAAAYRRADEALARVAPRITVPLPDWRKLAQAWGPSIIARFRAGPPLESTRG